MLSPRGTPYATTPSSSSRSCLLRRRRINHTSATTRRPPTSPPMMAPIRLPIEEPPSSESPLRLAASFAGFVVLALEVLEFEDCGPEEPDGGTPVDE